MGKVRSLPGLAVVWLVRGAGVPRSHGCAAQPAAGGGASQEVRMLDLREEIPQVDARQPGVWLT